MSTPELTLEHAALEATLEALDRPAFVIERAGAILHVNAAGRELLKLRGASDVRIGLCEAIQGKPENGYRAVPLAGALAETHFLAFAQTAAAEIAGVRAAQAARRWRLSARQTHVLELVLGGRKNADIARLLCIAVRTVEVHLTTIFDRAGVEGRSALVAAAMQL